MDNDQHIASRREKVVALNCQSPRSLDIVTEAPNVANIFVVNRFNELD
jgi:hypothetical protein